MEKKEVKISLWTFYVLVAAIVLLIGAVVIGWMKVAENKGANVPPTVAQSDKTNVIEQSSKVEEQQEKTQSESISTQKQNVQNNQQIPQGKDNTEFVQAFSQRMQKIKNSRAELQTEESAPVVFPVSTIIAARMQMEWKKDEIINGNSIELLTQRNGMYYTTTADGFKYEHKIIDTSSILDAFIEVTDDKEEAYIALAFNIENDKKTTNIKSYTPYKIEGINGKIKKGIVICLGQDWIALGQDAFVLMEDGTLKYVDFLEGIETGKFVAYDCKGIGKVQDIYQVDVMPEDSSGYLDVMIKKDDGKYYIWNYDDSMIKIENNKIADCEYYLGSHELYGDKLIAFNESYRITTYNNELYFRINKTRETEVSYPYPEMEPNGEYLISGISANNVAKSLIGIVDREQETYLVLVFVTNSGEVYYSSIYLLGDLNSSKKLDFNEKITNVRQADYFYMNQESAQYEHGNDIVLTTQSGKNYSFENLVRDNI